MKKNILVIYYTQSGQLKEIADRLVEPLEGCNVVFHEIRMKDDFLSPS